jgi:hypothetical protein
MARRDVVDEYQPRGSGKAGEWASRDSILCNELKSRFWARAIQLSRIVMCDSIAECIMVLLIRCVSRPAACKKDWAADSGDDGMEQACESTDTISVALHQQSMPRTHKIWARMANMGDSAPYRTFQCYKLARRRLWLGPQTTQQDVFRATATIQPTLEVLEWWLPRKNP